ncbi:MAG TPA: bifunctional phosphoribosyl-AMP cyclohydrolase/phosphoribosyl-ATP diphosphatase HisIE, partial [Chroococcales cyanobacterium]
EPVQELARKLGKGLTVAGGIATSQEVIELSKKGLDVQVGMALYKGLLNPVDTVIDSLTFNQAGLIPTIVKDEDGNVLMVAYSNKESLRAAIGEGRGVYFSRSRNQIWRKGDTSGAVQELISVRTDCDRDAILFKVRQQAGACHSGSYSCFDSLNQSAPFTLKGLFETLRERKSSASSQSYSARLFSDRKLLLQKIIEECGEVVTFRSKENLRHEIADALYHLSVLAVDEGLDWSEIESELAGRRR